MAPSKARAATERVGPFHVRCPFCGLPCTIPRLQPMTWCAGCYVEYYPAKDGRVMFDPKRQTPRFAIAKALARSGGARLGGEPK